MRGIVFHAELTVYSVDMNIIDIYLFSVVVFQSKSCPTLFDLMDCRIPGFLALLCPLEFAQIHVHSVGDGIQPSHPLSLPSPPAFKHFKHQGIFQ